MPSSLWDTKSKDTEGKIMWKPKQCWGDAYINHWSPGEQKENRFSLRTSKEKKYWKLEFEPLASQMWKEQISVVLNHQFYVLYYGNSKEFLQTIYEIFISKYAVQLCVSEN